MDQNSQALLDRSKQPRYLPSREANECASSTADQHHKKKKQDGKGSGPSIKPAKLCMFFFFFFKVGNLGESI